jgi:hypothetical protein
VRNGVETLCPADPKFLPTIPAEYKDLIQQDATSGTTPAPAQR